MKRTRESGVKRGLVCVAVAVALYYGVCCLFSLPVPRGTRVSAAHDTYYRNVRGIYFISVSHPLNLITHGHFGYLKGADERSFTVLDDVWAKDAEQVWYEDEPLEGADAASFEVDASGLPKDANCVYVFDTSEGRYRPARCGIDVETAEYFVPGHLRSFLMRDRDSVYFYEKPLDVDRNSFTALEKADWYIDDDYLYNSGYDASLGQWILNRVDSLRSPVDVPGPGSRYLRNGRNIIYCNAVIARDIDVKRFEEVGVDKCIVNDMLFLDGNRILEDSLDVAEAKFYIYGHIADDAHPVFYGRTRLDDIDAATFRQIDDETFEDRDFVYTIKEFVWKERYPFDRKRK